MAIKNKAEKGRFIAVGVANTALDFGILFVLKSLGLPTISANVVSTTAAFCFSFFANKKFTFKTTNTNTKRELILFIIVTLFGLWVLQSIVIQLALTLLGNQDLLSLLLAKLLATVVSLIWNYLFYSRVVFKRPT